MQCIIHFSLKTIRLAECDFQFMCKNINYAVIFIETKVIYKS